jgi:hypothetical protein
MTDIDDPNSGASLEAEIPNSVDSGGTSGDAPREELESVIKEAGERARAGAELVSQNPKRLLDPIPQKFFLLSLETRFHIQYELHKNIKWLDVRAALLANPEKIWSLHQLELTGGEPNVIDEIEGEFIFADCSVESPAGRRNVAYDKEGEDLFRKEFPDIKIVGNACDMATDWQVELIPEYAYRQLQRSIEIDAKALSWIETPDWFRKGGYAMAGHLDTGKGCWVKFTAGSCGERLGFRTMLMVLKV